MNDEVIDLLNTLIVTNNDRIEGYETASEDTGDADLKVLFAQFQQTSQRCRVELVNEVRRLGGTPDEGTRFTGRVYRMWLDLKIALTHDDRKTVIDWCECGENMASNTYQRVIHENHNDLSDQQESMLRRQHLALKADRDKVRAMHDELTEA